MDFVFDCHGLRYVKRPKTCNILSLELRKVWLRRCLTWMNFVSTKAIPSLHLWLLFFCRRSGRTSRWQSYCHIFLQRHSNWTFILLNNIDGCCYCSRGRPWLRWHSAIIYLWAESMFHSFASCTRIIFPSFHRWNPNKAQPGADESQRDTEGLMWSLSMCIHVHLLHNCILHGFDADSALRRDTVNCAYLADATKDDLRVAIPTAVAW